MWSSYSISDLNLRHLNVMETLVFLKRSSRKRLFNRQLTGYCKNVFLTSSDTFLCVYLCVQEKDLLNKPVMVLDDDSDRINRFRLALFPPEDKANRLISTVLKLEHTVWSLARPETGVPRSVMSIGQ